MILTEEREPIVDVETNKSEEEQSYGRRCNVGVHSLTAISVALILSIISTRAGVQGAPAGSPPQLPTPGSVPAARTPGRQRGENGAPSPLRPGTCSRRDPARSPTPAPPGTETAGLPADQRRLRVEVRTEPCGQGGGARGSRAEARTKVGKSGALGRGSLRPGPRCRGVAGPSRPPPPGSPSSAEAPGAPAAAGSWGRLPAPSRPRAPLCPDLGERNRHRFALASEFPFQIPSPPNPTPTPLPAREPGGRSQGFIAKK
nr:uncharacterized protein LOC102393332 [Bubalus bubalis]